MLVSPKLNQQLKNETVEVCLNTGTRQQHPSMSRTFLAEDKNTFFVCSQRGWQTLPLVGRVCAQPEPYLEHQQFDQRRWDNTIDSGKRSTCNICIWVLWFAVCISCPRNSTQYRMYQPVSADCVTGCMVQRTHCCLTVCPYLPMVI